MKPGASHAISTEAGEAPGYPRFKGQNRFDSFGLKEYGNGFKLKGRRLRLTGIGRMRVRWHRPIEGRVKTIRIHRQANGMPVLHARLKDKRCCLPAEKSVLMLAFIICWLPVKMRWWIIPAGIQENSDNYGYSSGGSVTAHQAGRIVGKRSWLFSAITNISPIVAKTTWISWSIAS